MSLAIVVLYLLSMRASGGPIVRVGLTRAFGTVRGLLLTVPAGGCLRGADGAAVALGPGTWTVVGGKAGLRVAARGSESAGAGDRLRAEAPPGGAITVATEGRPRRYRGTLEVRVVPGQPGAMSVVDELLLEEYLRGVVPAEMGASAPAEALKAQAVVARSYAVRVRGRCASRGFDLTDNTDCQVYDGVDAEKPATDAAVRDTNGQVLLRAGQVVETDYYDDCGGVTSAGEQDGDYPPSVADAPAAGPDYCAAGAHHTWALELSPADVERALGSSIRQAVGPVRAVVVIARDVSGRVRRVRLVGAKGQREIRGYQFRAMLGTGRLRSTLFNVRMSPDGRFVFDGRGWGHGHGMCQAGAIGLASAPYRTPCADILKHYFPGATVGLLQDPQR